MLRRFLIFTMSSTLLGCTTQQVVNTLTPPLGFTVSHNITFDARRHLKLDVYRPGGTRNRPVVVFFYGRRWEYGNKSNYAFIGATLASQGFVTVIPNYPLYPHARYKQILDDCARAVVWAHRFAHGYGGSPNKLLVMGFDAGAYNAAMLALDPHWLDDSGGRRAWLQGMIGISGPYDILPITAPDLSKIFGPAANYPLTQPVNWANGDNPPVLLIASRSDEVVDASNTDELYNRIQAANGPVEKVIYGDLSHDATVNVLSGPLRGRADILKNVTEFVRRVTHTPAPEPPPRL